MFKAHCSPPHTPKSWELWFTPHRDTIPAHLKNSGSHNSLGGPLNVWCGTLAHCSISKYRAHSTQQQLCDPDHTVFLELEHRAESQFNFSLEVPTMTLMVNDSLSVAHSCSLTSTWVKELSVLLLCCVTDQSLTWWWRTINVTFLVASKGFLGCIAELVYPCN